MSDQNLTIATLAGGCFWGLEELFQRLQGVVKTEVGYAGGASQNPTYEQVRQGSTGHAESIQIYFDSTQTDYKKILEYFFKIHDPTTKNKQGNDTGTQYRSVIFYHDDQQFNDAKEMIEKVNRSGVWGAPVVTELLKFGQFYLAEDYHQDYLIKNPGGYTCHFVRNIDFE